MGYHLIKLGGIMGPGMAAAILSLGTALAADKEYPGQVRVDIFTARSGATLADLEAMPQYPDHPDLTVFNKFIEFPLQAEGAAETDKPDNWGDDYGVTLTGLLRPPTTGAWVFYVAADDNADLWISTDENPANLRLVAREPEWSDHRYYFNTSSQQAGTLPATMTQAQREALPGWSGSDRGGAGRNCTVLDTGYLKCANNSDPINLDASKKYAFRARMKEGGGADNISVWATTTKNPYATLAADHPDYPITGPVPLGGNWISVIAPDVANFKSQPTNVTVVAGRTFRFLAAVNPTPDSGPFTYQWFRNGTPIAGATGAVYDSGAGDNPILADSSLNNSRYKLEATPASGPKLTSTEATLTVQNDVVPPVLTRIAGNDTFNAVTLVFNEGMHPDAFQAGAYSFSGGLTVTRVASPASNIVVLATSLQSVNKAHTLTFGAGVRDAAGNAIATRSVNYRSFAEVEGSVGYSRFSDNELHHSISTTRQYIATGGLPDFSETLARMISPVDVLDQYTGRMQTLFTPTQTGDYVFYVSSDDPGELMLSTDADPANKKLIAREPAWNGLADWNTRDRRPGCGTAAQPLQDCEHRSDQFREGEWETRTPAGKQRITLTAGRSYYVEVMWHGGGDGDNGAATFTLAGQPTPGNGTTAFTASVVRWFADIGNSQGGTPSLSWTFAGGRLTLTAENGTIEQADKLEGPYTAGPVSPASITPANGNKFFRVRGD